MDIILLGIYAFFVWLIFFKFKWLPWNIVSQVIVVTLPVIALTLMILFVNICAPSSSDVRAMNYVIPIVPRVTGQVTEVPIEPNRPIKKGDVLFKIDPVPFELAVKAAEAKLEGLKVALVTAQASERSLEDQIRNAAAKKDKIKAEAKPAIAAEAGELEKLRARIAELEGQVKTEGGQG